MKQYTFDAEIRAGRSGGAYVVFPYDAEKEFGTNGKVPVKATIDGVPGRRAVPDGDAASHARRTQAIRDKLEAPGDIVAIVLSRDDSRAKSRYA
jgi:ABC-type sugar transport system substrate-binding protein